MSTNAVRGIDTSVARVDLKLEVVVIPVSDVDHAKEFYGKLGWRLDADFRFDNGFRIVQFTPPGSECSVQFGTNMTPAAPGSAQSLYLVVSDIAAACDRSRGMLQTATFIADGNQVRIFRSGGLQALPGSVGRTAIDDDDFGGSKSLLHQTLDQRVDIIDFIEDGRGHAYGWHVE